MQLKIVNNIWIYLNVKINTKNLKNYLLSVPKVSKQIEKRLLKELRKFN